MFDPISIGLAFKAMQAAYDGITYCCEALSEGKVAVQKIKQATEDAKTIVKVFEIETGAIATSGLYERGAHIIDPQNGMVAIGARSATVIGPDDGLADALATALVVSGKDGARWFSNPLLAEYGAWVIERHSDEAWGINLK